MQKNIVIVSSSFWNSKLWFRRQHFACRFAESDWRVLYVNPPFSILRPFFKKNQIPVSALFDFLFDSWNGENLKIINLFPGLPCEGQFTWVNIFNRFFWGLYIENKAKKFFNNEPFVLITYNPLDFYLGIKNNLLLVYECVDEHSAYPQHAKIKDFIISAESLLLKMADMVTVTSSSLMERRKKYKDDIELVPNGVDIKLYEHLDISAPIPADMKEINKPIIIYAGAIFEWFNLPLITKMCNSHPDWSVVLIGPQKILGRDVLPNNLFYLGVKDWKSVPAYLANADVAIIPFLNNELTVNVNPLKMYEYFAAGLTCVSCYMHEISKFAEPYVLEMANNEDEFIYFVERNIGKKDVGMERKTFIAHEYSWDKIFARFENLLIERLAKVHK